MAKFRKKPIVIEAIQWDGSAESSRQIAEFGKGKITWWFNHNFMEIETLEGTMSIALGDWVIKGVKGEFYPCKPDIFEQTYELVREVGLDG